MQVKEAVEPFLSSDMDASVPDAQGNTCLHDAALLSAVGFVRAVCTKVQPPFPVHCLARAALRACAVFVPARHDFLPAYGAMLVCVPGYLCPRFMA